MTQPPGQNQTTLPCSQHDHNAISSGTPLPLRRTDVVVHPLDREALLYDPETMSTHQLNETALLIWNLCDGQTSAADMSRRLSHSYDVTQDEAAEHVATLLQNLGRMRLLCSRIGSNQTSHRSDNELGHSYKNGAQG